MVTITKTDGFKNPVDYDIKVLDTWKNYDKPNALFKIDLISFKAFYNIDPLIKMHTEDLRNAINHNDIYEEYHFDKNIYKNESNIPLLAPCGIGNIIDPSEMFYAVEEYFSIEKTRAETTEAKGATNDDKIIMHGFDTKTSFRGK